MGEPKLKPKTDYRAQAPPTIALGNALRTQHMGWSFVEVLKRLAPTRHLESEGGSGES